MRELSSNEIDAVSGGVQVSAVRWALGSSPAPALLALSYFAGYKVGTLIYNTYTSFRY